MKWEFIFKFSVITDYTANATALMALYDSISMNKNFLFHKKHPFHSPFKRYLSEDGYAVLSHEFQTGSLTCGIGDNLGVERNLV